MYLFQIGLWLFTMQVFFPANICQDKEVFRLEDLRWKKRVVVFYADSPTALAYTSQLEAFHNRKAVAERDLVFVHIFKNGNAVFENRPLRMEDARRVLQQLNPQQAANQLWLIGKDGGVKYQATMPVKAENIYGLIDSMPMRQQEMRQQKGGGTEEF